MHADRFRTLLDARSPFVSICFEDSHDTADAGAQLEARLRDIRKHLEEKSVDHRVMEVIDNAVHAAHPPVGRSGRCLIVSAAAADPHLVLDEHLIRPPTATEMRVSELPYLMPVIDHGMMHASYLLVAVDHTGADITLRDGRTHTQSVDGSGHPVHKAHRAETAGYGGPQGAVDEAVRKNLREVAHQVTRLFDETGPGMVFLTGDARAELAAELPDRVAATAVQLAGGGRAAGADTAALHHQIGQEYLALRLAVIEDAAQRFTAGRGTGLAVEGLAEVTAALRDGAVDTLIVGDLGDATVVADHEQLTLMATDAATVSALGGAPDRVLRADEALPVLAVSGGSSVVRTDERLSPADGVGAVLRYADPNLSGQYG